MFQVEYASLRGYEIMSILGPWTPTVDQDIEGYVITLSSTPLPCVDVLSIVVSLF